MSEAEVLSPSGFVTDPINHWASTLPTKTAMIGNGQSWTYAQLEARTNALCRTLQSRGVKRGDRVGFILPRGPETILLIIAILKCGATYVPMAADSPPKRIQDCLEDSQPSLVVLPPEWTHDLGGDYPTSTLAELLLDSNLQSEEPITGERQPSDLAYMIFTSGSTGRPKGVPIRHESLTNFIIGNQETCIQVGHDERVLQCYSPASDGHHEEIWPTFLAGATLVVANDYDVHSGEDLAKLMREQQVNIVSCAPTLLAMVDGDIPSLRRVLFGAESLPPAMVDRWWTPNRAILNTYGPTEATVGTTFGVCEPGKTINIGTPLPGYHCYVLNDDLSLSDGEGQLGIAGISVAEGYYGRPDLTEEKFKPNPHAGNDPHAQIVYLTGDRVRRDENGDLIWMGRIDNQVKIRGHRIELSEIESQIVEAGWVKSAVVVVRRTEDGEPYLVALILARDESELNAAELTEDLREKLPPHMVPQILELVDAIPVLPSGKIDRRACDLTQGRAIRVEREIVPPTTDNERLIHGIFTSMFPGGDVSCTDDFFADLGGHSLLASKFVSVLRSDHGFSRVSVVDLYDRPTVRSLAALLDGMQATTRETVEENEFHPIDPRLYRNAKIWQALGVLFSFGLQGIYWMAPIVTAVYWSQEDAEWKSLLQGLAVHAISVPILFILAIIVKWVVVGKSKPGSYPMWSPQFVRWWFVRQICQVAPVNYITGTPFASIYLRAMGAKIGKNVIFESLDFDAPDLIEVGDDCIFESSSWLHPAEVRGGQFHLYPVKVGNGCLLGVRAGVTGGATLEQGATLLDMTCATSGMTVPKDTEWLGRDQYQGMRVTPLYEPDKQPSTSEWRAFGFLQAVLLLVMIMLEAFPFTGMALWFYNATERTPIYLLEPVFAVGIVLVAAVQILIVKWGVLGRFKAGTYRYPSWSWLRKWFADKHLELLTNIVVPVYDSLLARKWCQALGMKCGPRCEIALPLRMPYDLVELGEESFIASQASIGMPMWRNGEVSYTKTTLGRRVFLGNDSVLPQGTNVPDQFLLGVMSVCPANEVLGDQTGQAFLGTPAFPLPQRNVHDEFDPTLTYNPRKRTYAHRSAHEVLRIVLPSVFDLLVFAGLIEAFTYIWNETDFGVALACIPVIYLFASAISLVICLICKKLLVGTYRASIHPLWSSFVWRAETYSTVLHDFGDPLFFQHLSGTPYLATVMRLLGARIGRRAYINSMDWTETDLIHIGEDAAINSNAPLQVHLFEDRVMKLGPIRIGDRATVGIYSVVLCDSQVKSDAQIGHLSLVMKGETIPSHTRWAGAPSREAR